MAKPFQGSETSISPFFQPDFIPFIGAPSPRRKRARDVEPTSDHESSFARDFSDDTHKTRRVNPLRLATRLGPSLVAEMEALIVPGAKMPPFSVRKDFQERYNVDRRHIYDYFHSRGLRVAKEDRHTNLTRGRLSKALAQQPVQQVSTDHKPAEKENAPSNVLPMVTVQAKPSPINFQVPMVRTAKRLASEKISGAQPRRRLKRLRSQAVPGFSPTLSPVTTHPCIAYSSDAFPQQDLASSHASSPCPEFSMDDETSSSFSLVGGARAFNPVSENAFQLDASDAISDFSLDPPFDNSGDSLVAIEEHRPLTELERSELYALINNSISSTPELEESCGTYGAYMKERSRVYFERLSFKATYGTKIYRAHEGSLRSSSRAMGDDVDFTKWLLPSARPEADLATLTESWTSTTTLRPDTLHKIPITSAPSIQAATTYQELVQAPRRLETQQRSLALSDVISGTEDSTDDVSSTQISALHFRYDVDVASQLSSSVRLDERVEDQQANLAQVLQLNSPDFITTQLDQPDQLAPSAHITKSNLSADTNTKSNPPTDFFRVSDFISAFSGSPDRRNAFWSSLKRARPSRLRTTSAGGGM
ncbi:hypothetical protein Hypma_015956 [Hypsizygus marmoreus]|uniref:Uncharacterized protein n=1 Tax=Hypsizygus marmoreus TaxID=39966 RepID=A0A369K691_HYPMA|nr:hypothetical protein Hypma_015956 [Hypsizygus marmoreus]